LGYGHEDQNFPFCPYQVRWESSLTIDATTQEELQSWGDIIVLLRSWWLQDFKNAVHCPLKTTCSLRNCKKTCSDRIVNSEPQLLWNCFLDGKFARSRSCRIQFFKQLMS
jgi:hypothetical protein